MAAEPSENAIQSFISLSGLPRSNAIRWLKANNNDANNAAMSWIDGGQAELPPPPRKEDIYSEQIWHADRDGNMPQSQLQASGLIDRVPPTRPSSRVDSMRPVYGPENHPDASQPHDYERDLQMAKQMSLSGSQTLPSQETGVTQSNQYFGPPTQNAYDSDAWAMTVPESKTQEILLGPEPPDRKRGPGAPAFLRPSASSNNLAPFLVILHAIPLARETLLHRDLLINDYGRASDWWDGTSIRSLRVVNTNEDHQQHLSADLIHETQRLMAFLDNTERAYGSADALVRLPSFEMTAEGLTSSFLAAWISATEACVEGPPPVNLFKSRGIMRPKGSMTAAIDEEIYCLHLEVKSEDRVLRGFSLYEAIDDFITKNSEEDTETYIDKLGEIFTFDITSFVHSSEKLGIAVPPIWYADRYMEDSVSLLDGIRAEQEKEREAKEHLRARRDLLSLYNTPGVSPSPNVAAVMKSVSKYIHDKAIEADAAGQTDRVASLEKIAEQMRGLLETVKTHLDRVNDMEDGIPDRILTISDKLKRPGDAPESSPKHRYLLMGVILRTSTAFVLEPAAEEAADGQTLSPSVPGHQWWKIDYEATALTPVQTLKVTEEDVLEAARNASTSVFLVYASDNALAHENKPLPVQLQNFVKADNISFQAEIEDHDAQKTQEMSWNATSTPHVWSNPNQTWEGPPALPSDFPTPLAPRKNAAAEDSDMEVERGDDSDDSNEMEGAGFISNKSSPLDPSPFERPPEPMEMEMQQQQPQQQQQKQQKQQQHQAAAMGLNGRLPVTYQPQASPAAPSSPPPAPPTVPAPQPDQEMKEVKRE